MTVRDIDLYSQAKSAAAALMRHYRKGAYRVIRDPEGVVSFWAIDGSPYDPFSISFVDKGRVYYKIEDTPPDLLRSFLEYLQKTARKRG